MTKTLTCGALTAMIFLCGATAASAQDTAAPAVVAATDTAPLVPGGAAGAPAQSPVDAFWASLTGMDRQSDAATTRTASTDTH